MTAIGRQRPFSAILLEGPLSGAKRTSKTLEILDSDFRFRPEADMVIAALEHCLPKAFGHL